MRSALRLGWLQLFHFRSALETSWRHYHLLTIWRIQAPLEAVYDAIHNTPRWTDWWPGVMKVEKLAAGDPDGINSILRYFWQGRLPYRIVFEVRATRIEKQVAMEGAVQGDLEGIGRWHFSNEGEVSVVRYEWHVHSTRWWMNLIAPFARSMFIRNHGILMRQGAEGLARPLDAPLVSQESIDMLAQKRDGRNRPAKGSARTGATMIG